MGLSAAVYNGSFVLHGLAAARLNMDPVGVKQILFDQALASEVCCELFEVGQVPAKNRLHFPVVQINDCGHCRSDLLKKLGSLGTSR